MFFSRKRKLLKDREAGLVFNWRGSRGYQLGKIFSLIVTVLFLGFAVYVLKVEDVQPPMVSKREAAVTMIDQSDPSSRKLISLINQRSPFPPRWDPAYDPAIYQRLDEGLEKLMGGHERYDPDLLPMPEEKVTERLISVVPADDGLFYKELTQSASEEKAVEHKPQGELLLNVSMQAESSINERLLSQYYALPDDLVTQDSYGQSYEFIVGLDGEGAVISCLPTNGGSIDVVKPSDSQRQLVAWLSQQKFKPSEEANITVGLIELQVEAIRTIAE